MAIYGFKGFGWFLCGMIVVPACYAVTSYVAAERGRMEALDAKIVEAHKQIRELETEFAARTSMVHMQAWNGKEFAFAAPEAEQFAPESALASLDPSRRHAGAEVQSARLVIPAESPHVEPAVALAAADTGSPATRPGDRQAVAAVRPARTEAMAALDRKLLSPETLSELVRAGASDTPALR